MTNKYNILDKFFSYTENFNIHQFIYQFYEIERPQYHELPYFIEKANLLLYNPGRFWSSLDDENKKKFMNMLNCYNSNVIIEIPLPPGCQLIYKYENGRKQYELYDVSTSRSESESESYHDNSD
jgi:uncharacterized protein YbgA (DUF1722 family)